MDSDTVSDTTEQQWTETATRFNTAWNFPQREGAMDGKHVQIEAPQNNGSIYYTSKGTVKVESLMIKFSEII